MFDKNTAIFDESYQLDFLSSKFFLFLKSGFFEECKEEFLKLLSDLAIKNKEFLIAQSSVVIT